MSTPKKRRANNEGESRSSSGAKRADTTSQFTELVCKRACKYILSLSRAQLRSLLWDEESLHDKEGQKRDVRAYLQEVQQFCHRALLPIFGGDDEAWARVKMGYRYRFGANACRKYAGAFGYQRMQSKLRNFLAAGRYWDLDQANAFPSLLAWRAREEFGDDAGVPLLDSYVAERRAICAQHGFQKRELLMVLHADELVSNKKDVAKGKVYVTRAWLKRFHDEKVALCKRLHAKLAPSWPHNYPETNGSNPLSSWLSKYLQHFENECVQKVADHLGVDSIGALMFDGLSVDKEAVPEVDVEALAALTAPITWALKPTETDIVVPDDFDDAAATDYATVKPTFEYHPCGAVKWALCQHPFGFLHQKRCARTGVLVSGVVPPHAARVLLGNVLALDEDARGNIKMASIFDQWIKDPSRLEFQSIDWVPYHGEDATPALLFNQFQPFTARRVGGVVDESHPAVRMFRDLVGHVVGGDASHRDWLVKYLAHIVQRPWKNQKLVIILRGPQGTGKDTLMDVMAAIFGDGNRYLTRTANQNEVFGTFNSALKHKLIVQLNEASAADGFRNNNMVKDLSTKDEITVNEKYIAEYQVVNYAHIFYMCNGLSSPLPVSTDDRRNVIYETSDAHKGDTPFWDNIHENLKKDQAAINALFTYMMDMDLSHFSAKDCRPVTQAYLNAQLHDCDKTYMWLADLCHAKFEGYEQIFWTRCGELQYAAKKQLVSACKKWHEEMSLTFPGGSFFTTQLQSTGAIAHGVNAKKPRDDMTRKWVEVNVPKLEAFLKKTVPGFDPAVFLGVHALSDPQHGNWASGAHAPGFRPTPAHTPAQ